MSAPEPASGSATAGEPKGILKKDGQPSRDVGDVSINAPEEDLNKSKSSRILNREDTKHHVLEGVEWPEGEEAPKAVLSKPPPRGPKGSIKKEPVKSPSTASATATPATPPAAGSGSTTSLATTPAAASPSPAVTPSTSQERSRGNSDAKKATEKKSTCQLL